MECKETRNSKFDRNSFVCLLYINLSNKDIEPNGGKKKKKPVNTLIGLIRSIYLPTSLKK